MRGQWRATQCNGKLAPREWGNWAAATASALQEQFAVAIRKYVVRGVSNLRSERFGHHHVNCFAIRKGVRAADWAEALRRGEGGGRKERRSELCNAEVLV